MKSMGNCLKRREPPTPLSKEDIENNTEDMLGPIRRDDGANEKISTAEEIGKRKILRIKRPGAVETSDETEIKIGNAKKGFTLADSLPGEEEQPKSSPKKLFGEDNGQSLFSSKIQVNQTNLFGTKAVLEPKPEPVVEKQPEVTKPAEPIVESKSEEPKKQETSIFGNSTGGSLFGNKAGGGTSLFGNTSGTSLFGNNAGGGSLFGKKEEAENTEKKSSIFGDMGKPAEGGLFSGLTNPTESNGTGGLNIFGSSVKSSGLFDSIKKPADSTVAQNPDEIEKEVAISSRFAEHQIKLEKVEQVESSADVLFKGSVSNFKVDQKTGFGPGEITIEQTKGDVPLKLLIFRDGAAKILFTGILFKQVSQCDYMKGKTDALYVYAIQKVEGVATRVICKMAFILGADVAKDFKAQVEKISKHEQN